MNKIILQRLLGTAAIIFSKLTDPKQEGCTDMRDTRNLAHSFAEDILEYHTEENQIGGYVFTGLDSDRLEILEGITNEYGTLLAIDNNFFRFLVQELIKTFLAGTQDMEAYKQHLLAKHSDKNQQLIRDAIKLFDDILVKAQARDHLADAMAEDALVKLSQKLTNKKHSQDMKDVMQRTIIADAKKSILFITMSEMVEGFLDAKKAVVEMYKSDLYGGLLNRFALHCNQYDPNMPISKEYTQDKTERADAAKDAHNAEPKQESSARKISPGSRTHLQ